MIMKICESKKNGSHNFGHGLTLMQKPPGDLNFRVCGALFPGTDNAGDGAGKTCYYEKMEIPERGGPVERLKNAHIEGIQNEYRRINAKWLQMHYRLLLWLALFTVFMEIVMFFVLGRIDAITASNTVYLVKYLLIPSPAT